MAEVPNWNGSLVEPPHDPRIDRQVQELLAAVRPDVAEALEVVGGLVSTRMAEERTAAEQATERYQAAAAELARHLALPPRQGYIERLPAADHPTQKETAMPLLDKAKEFGDRVVNTARAAVDRVTDHGYRDQGEDVTSARVAAEDFRRWEDTVGRNQARHAEDQAVRDVAAHEEAVRLGLGNVDEAIEAGRQMEDGEYEALPDDDPRYNGPRYDADEDISTSDAAYDGYGAEHAAEVKQEQDEHDRWAAENPEAAARYDTGEDTSRDEAGDGYRSSVDPDAWRDDPNYEDDGSGNPAIREDVVDDRTSLERALRRTDNDCDRATQERRGSDLAADHPDRGEQLDYRDDGSFRIPGADEAAARADKLFDEHYAAVVGPYDTGDTLPDDDPALWRGDDDPDREALSAVADAGAAAAVADAREAETAADTSGAYSGSDYDSSVADDSDADTDVA